MTYKIFPTTAEHIVSATDAVLLKPKSCNESFVSSLLDIPSDNAKNALKMSVQLGLIAYDSQSNTYLPENSFSTYLATGKEKQKSAVLRLVLEQYEPYKLFKNRLSVLGFAHEAAEHIKIFYNLETHREEIKNTITSLGTYTQSLISKGAGIYNIAEAVEDNEKFFINIDNIVSEREEAEIIVRKLLGEKTTNWIDNNETLQLIITAYHNLSYTEEDERSPILYAGNAFESFLVKLADNYNVNIDNAGGINAKIEKISREGYMTKKHKFMGKYLGHIRNACDHGIDSEINQNWTISQKTSHEYVHVAISCIKANVEAIDGIYIL